MKKSVVVLLIVAILLSLWPTALAASDPEGPVSTVADVVWLRPTGNKKWNITSGIGKRNLGYGSTSHHGTDLGSVGTGTSVLAARAGTAYNNGYSVSGGYNVIIDHGDGFYTKYQHLSQISFTGSIHVEAGDVIGKTGGTGHSGASKCLTGAYYKDGKRYFGACKNAKGPNSPHAGYDAHLHFEIAYCSKGAGQWKNYGKIWSGKYGWGTDGWVVYNAALQTYTTDKNDPRLQKYSLTDEGRYYCRALTNVSCYIYPDDGSTTAEPIPSGYGIIVIGKYVDKKTNQSWYKTEKNVWIKPAQVTALASFPSQMASGNETKETKRPFTAIVTPIYDVVYLEAEPYSTYVNENNHKGMIPVRANESLTVKNVWQNKHGNYWLEFTNGRFLCANNVREFACIESADVWIDGQVFPEHDLTVGKGFDIKGTVKSTYDITQITGGVYLPLWPYPKFDSQFVKTLTYDTPIKSLNLYNSNINVASRGGISFGKLPKGIYTFRLSVNYNKLVWRDITDPKQSPYITEPQTKVFASNFTVGMGKESEAALGDIVEEIKVTGITLNETSKTLAIGEILSLSETITPNNASNPKVSWSSSNEAVATVENGKVTAVGKGTATITVTAEDGSHKAASCTVTVLKLPESISVSGGHDLFLNDNANKTVQLTSIVLPADASDTSVTWSSSNDSIATVSNTGLVTAKGLGTATITATANGNTSLLAQCQVEVKNYITGLDIIGNDEVAVGGYGQYKVSITPSTASDQSISWATNNNNIATIDRNGVVQGVSQGTVIITATATDRNTVFAQKEISVYQPIKEISISGTNALTVGKTTTLTTHVLPTNANISKITWSTDNAAIATVNQNGVVTAKGNGIVYITASASDDSTVKATHEIEVTTLISSLTVAEIESVDVGATATYQTTITPSTASNKKLIWSVDDESIASVDSTGRITGLAPGFVSVTATTTDGSNISSSVLIEIIQKVQSISVDIPPVAYIGDVIEPNIIILPENASYREVAWTSSNTDIVRIDEHTPEEENTDVENWYTFKCVGAGTVRLTATATDGSGVAGSAYIQVRSNVELQRHTLTFNLITTGNGKDMLGRVALTADCSSRTAEAGQGAVWSIEHVSGDYAATIGISEQTATYGGVTIANAAAVNLLRVNKAGSDVYRVSCTINGYTDSCTVTVNVTEPENPLPESVTLSTATFHGTVNESIAVTTTPICAPSGSSLPSTASKYLYGIDAFNRYAEVTKNGEVFNVRFAKAGTYTARLQFSGANYQYEAILSFFITDSSGTVPAEIESLSFDDSVLYLLAGETSQLSANIQPASADETTLTWDSSDTNVATVDQSGNVTAIGQGTTIITVAADNGVTSTALVYVTDSLLTIDWNADNIIRVYLDGSSKTTIQKVFLTPRASSSLTTTPSWNLKRLSGNNLTLTVNPTVIAGDNGENYYGCEIILKSASSVGITEYELSCSDGIHEATTTIRVEAVSSNDVLPSLISWQNSTFTGNVDQLLTVYPNVVCWPDGTTLPDAVMISFEGDSYWNAAINGSDYTVSRDMMTFSFSEPGVYTANCVYACSNMRYLVPVTFRIKDSAGNVPVRVSSLALNTNEVSIEAGNTFQLNAYITPDDATNKEVTWSVEDTTIATVNNNGLVTGVSNGRTTVWCTPSDTSCDPVKCIVVIEDAFTITQTEEMSYQYLQGETGNAVASFSLSSGTAKRIEAEGVTPAWNLSRISGNAADVVLQEHNGVMYIMVTALNKAGTDTYEVTCNAGNHSWSGRASLEVAGISSNVPASVTIATTQYTANVNEEVELDFTPVCQPSTSAIPSDLRSSYIGIGEFYQGLVDSYRTSVLTARNDTIKVAFKKPGTYILSRAYRSCNLNYVTECTITVGAGNLNLLKCTDQEPVVYIGGKSSIATTCVLSDISVEELYGADLVWNAERLSGDCLTVALRADQSSASLYVVNAKAAGTELWRVSCTFHGITSYVDITIHAVEPRTTLPESVVLYQAAFDGMIGKNITVPLAVTCTPAGTVLPETSGSAWSFVTDGFGTDHATWTIVDEKMVICFAESGYYGGRLVYESGNVKYEFPVTFAIVDEESTQNVPSHLDVSLDKNTVIVYPEGDIGVNIVRAVLSDSLDEYSISSVASYAERMGAIWSIETTSGSACSLTIDQINAASVQIKLASISGYGDVTYKLNCSIAGNTYSSTGTVHVASSSEARPQAKLKQNYFTTTVGSVLTIDASFYDRTTSAKLCSGRESTWDNQSALAAMGFDYNTSGDSWLPVFYEEGSYTTTATAWIGNLKLEEELLICVYRDRPLPSNPSTITIPGALQTIEDEAFYGIPVNVVDLRDANVKTIGQKAFAGCTGLLRIYIPQSVTLIADNAFDGCSGFVVYCAEGSTADTWAKAHGIPALYGND